MGEEERRTGAFIPSRHPGGWIKVEIRHREELINGEEEEVKTKVEQGR